MDTPLKINLTFYEGEINMCVGAGSGSESLKKGCQTEQQFKQTLAMVKMHKYWMEDLNYSIYKIKNGHNTKGMSSIQLISTKTELNKSAPSYF